LLNVEGYYDSLIVFLDHVLAEQFVKKEQRDLLIVETNPEVLLDRYANYQPPAVRHWVGKDET
jgi:predicted Rossmann-fold nucleotide-binding protein